MTVFRHEEVRFGGVAHPAGVHKLRTSSGCIMGDSVGDVMGDSIGDTALQILTKSIVRPFPWNFDSQPNGHLVTIRSNVQ